MLFNAEGIVDAKQLGLEQRIAELQKDVKYYSLPPTVLVEKTEPAYKSDGYQNISDLLNIPLFPFDWGNIPALGMIGVESGQITINDLLKRDQQEFQKTLGHEGLHYTLGMMWNTNDSLPSGNGWYLMRVLTNWIYCTQPEKLRNYN